MFFYIEKLSIPSRMLHLLATIDFDQDGDLSIPSRMLQNMDLSAFGDLLLSIPSRMLLVHYKVYITSFNLSIPSRMLLPVVFCEGALLLPLSIPSRMLLQKGRTTHRRFIFTFNSF